MNRLTDIKNKLLFIEKKISQLEKMGGKGEIQQKNDKTWDLTYLGHSHGFSKPVGNYKKKYYAVLAARRRGINVIRFLDSRGKEIKKSKEDKNVST